jgi:hypothetical protein
MSVKKRSSRDGKQLLSGSCDIRRWTTEQLEQEIAKDLPPNPPLEHLFRLRFEHDSVPPLLFHYTREEAAKSIIRTSSVWASDAYELNDRQEVEYPCRLLRDEIKHHQICFLKRGERLFADLCSALLKVLVTPRETLNKFSAIHRC